jgi:Zn-finger nucleic acid-binding protein
MKIVKYDYIQVDKCTSCNGIWFDLMELQDLKKMKGSEKIDSIKECKPVISPVVDKKVKCPKCNVKMHTMKDILQHHIEYEQCGSCKGVFLDAGEFTDLKDFTLKEFYQSLKKL